MKKALVFSIVALVAIAAIYTVWLGLRVESDVANSTPKQAVSYANNYVGAQACQQCHQEQYQQWQSSDHAKAMQEASPATVLGDFSNRVLEFHSIKTRLYQNNGQFLVDTSIDGATTQTFSVSYTFGHYPLQQYLIELDNGHVQALNIAWDSRPEGEGGQRWFHLRADESMNPEQPFFWTKHFQNWNSRCAECHSTKVSKNYRAEDHSYNTAFEEINVACEACHGPAGEHIARLDNGSYSAVSTGFSERLHNTNQFLFNEHTAIAVNASKVESAQLNSCAGCHSRRGHIGEVDVGNDYHDQYRLGTIDESLYFADGQINDEVFVYGSFLQSKMHEAGVVCSNCHNPHSGKVTLAGDNTCLQCHKANVFQAKEHHQHPVDSAGAACVSCHMPERLYMGVDERRDHSFSIPRPALASKVGAPNACKNCHVDWSNSETNTAYEGLFGEEPPLVWAQANQHARNFNMQALEHIMQLASDTRLNPIRRASLLRHGANFPAQASFDAMRAGLSDSDPIVRAAAIEGSAFVAPEHRLPLLAPLIHDPSKVVRMAVANQLLAAATSPSALALLTPLFDEDEQSLLLTQDTPATQINLGSFYYHRGNVEKAEQAYQRALMIEPAFAPAMVNLADLYRAMGDDGKAHKYLSEALKLTPDSAAVQYSMGLLYVRQKKMDEALIHLSLAQSLGNAVPRYAYVYAVALESVQRLGDAVTVLNKADKRWPNQPEITRLLAEYSRK